MRQRRRGERTGSVRIIKKDEGPILCSTDLSKSGRPAEGYEDIMNESENELNDNDNNVHDKQDAAETESTSEARHGESVLETRSSVSQANQSNSQDGSQNGGEMFCKGVVKVDICDVCKKLFHFKCAGTTKEKVLDAGVLIQ